MHKKIEGIVSKQQKGATIWVNLIWILMAVVIAVAGVKLIPLYLDNFTVAGALDGLKSEQELSKLKDRDIRKVLGKHFTINNVRNISKEQINIEREKNELLAINIDYEVREHLFYNVYVILSFKNRLDVQDIK